MFKFGKGPAPKVSSRSTGAHLDLKDGALHALELLRRAARDIGDSGLDSKLRKLHTHLGRAHTDAQLESVSLELQDLRWPARHDLESEGSNGVVARCAESAKVVARAVGIADFTEGLSRIIDLAEALDFDKLMQRFDVEQERIAQGVLFLRQTAEILRCSVAELVAILSPLAGDEPDALRRLRAVRERIEATTDLSELERLREELVRQASVLVEEAQARADRASEARHLLQIHESHVKVLELALADANAMATTDPLTGLGNRRSLERFVEQQKTSRSDVAVIATDIDHFKKVNDKYGHDVGDRVLRVVAEVIRAEIRGADHAYRTGGEEFVVVLPGTPLPGAQATAERLRAEIESQLVHVSTQKTIRVTVSLGVSIWGSGISFNKALKAADSALYRAKEAGRNQVVTRLS